MSQNIEHAITGSGLSDEGKSSLRLVLNRPNSAVVTTEEARAILDLIYSWSEGRDLAYVAEKRGGPAHRATLKLLNAAGMTAAEFNPDWTRPI